MTFEDTVQEYYLPYVQKIVQDNFPEYWDKMLKTDKHKRRGMKVISDEEVLHLIDRYKKHGDILARDRLIFSQLILVCYVTKDFFYKVNGNKLSPEDLLGFANQILLKLIDSYDPYTKLSKKEINEGKINKLPSYIRTYLTFYLHKELKNYGLIISLPHNQINDISSCKKLISKFNNKNGRSPYDGEEIVYKKNNITYKAVFNICDKNIELYEMDMYGGYFLKNVHTIQLKGKTISGNTYSPETENELFDNIEGEHNIDELNTDTLIRDSIKEVLETLELRDRESIELFFYKNQTIKDIPSMLTPNISCNKEMKRLKQTSTNKVDIYLELDGVKTILTYNIIANYHLNRMESDEVDIEGITTVTHKNINISTNKKYDRYIFNILKHNVIKIVHESHNSSEELEFSFENNVLSFDVEYGYGHIFTSQTFINQHQKVLNILRKKLKHVKKNIYE